MPKHLTPARTAETAEPKPVLESIRDMGRKITIPTILGAKPTGFHICFLWLSHGLSMISLRNFDPNAKCENCLNHCLGVTTETICHSDHFHLTLMHCTCKQGARRCWRHSQHMCEQPSSKLGLSKKWLDYAMQILWLTVKCSRFLFVAMVT